MQTEVRVFLGTECEVARIAEGCSSILGAFRAPDLHDKKTRYKLDNVN